MAVFMTSGGSIPIVGNKKTITVSVSDNGNGLIALTTTKGTLKVSGIDIVATNNASATENMSVYGKTVEVEFTMIGDITKPRKLSVDGVSLGTFSATGQTVKTTVNISNGYTISIKFTT